MERRSLTLILVLSLILSPPLLLITACNEAEQDKNPITDTGDSSIDSVKRQDEEGLVEISVDDGLASIYFNLDRWDELYGIYDADPDYYNVEGMQEGPFPILVESGLVKDAVIGKVQLLDYSCYEFSLPVVVLLMDNGSLEWIYADPYMTVDYSYLGGEYQDYENFLSNGKISRVDDYTHFFYESDKEGIGDKNIYVTNINGDVFDFYYLWMETKLYGGTWICELWPPTDWSEYSLNAYMIFEEDGSFYYDIGEGFPYGEAEIYLENWGGTAELVTSLDQDYPLGTLLYDIEITWWMVEGDLIDDDLDLSMHLKGSYRIFVDSDGSLGFSHKDGDDIYQVNRDIKKFNFTKYVGHEE